MDVPAEDRQELFLGYYLFCEVFQFRHQFFTLCEDASPDVLVCCTAHFFKLAECCFKSDNAKRFGSCSPLIIYHSFCIVSFNDVSGQFDGFCPLESQRLLCEDVCESPAAQLLLIKEIRQGEASVYVMSQSEESQLDVFELDRWILFQSWYYCGLFLLTPFFLVFCLNETSVFPLSFQLLSQIVNHFTKTIVIDAQISFFLIFIRFFSFVYLLCFSELFALSLESIMVELELMESFLECFMSTVQGLQLLIFLFLLIRSELLSLLEDHVLVIICHSLDLSIFGCQCSTQLISLFTGICYLTLLESLPRLQEVFIVLVKSNDRFQFFILFFIELHKLIFDAFVLCRQGSQCSFESNSLFDQILLFHASLLKNTHMWQLFQFFYLLF